MSSLLVVENHAPSREYLARVLQAGGHRVQVADDAQGAWELFAHGSFDAVLISLTLPPAEALDLVGRVRSAASPSQVVTFDHAHLGQEVGLPAAMKLRPDAYVADVSRRELTDRLGELLGRGDDLRAGSGVAAVLARPPVIQGQLKGDALASALVTLWGTFRDGVLVLQHGETERRIYLRFGRPVSYDSTLRSEAFDRFLYDRKKISEAHFREALAERASGGLSAAAALVAVGALESGPPLMEVLREHLQAMVAQAVGLRLGVFRFHAGDEFIPEVQVLEVQTQDYLLAGARDSFALKIFLQAIHPERERFPRRSDDFASLLPQLGLAAKDLKIAMEIGGRTRTQDLLAVNPGALRDVASLLWFLRLSGAVVFDSEATGAGPTLQPPRLKTLSGEELSAVREEALAVLPATYFRALGLDIASTPDEVEAAYHRIAERFHRDRYAGFDLGEVADLLDQMQDKLAAGYRTLSDPEKRQAYLVFLLRRAEGPLRGGRPLDARAEVAAKQAERALRERRFHAAVEHLRRATQTAAHEPDFWSHLALAQLLDEEVARDLRLSQARASARKAVSLDKGSARALAALALVEFQAGQPSEARQRALAAMRLDARHPLAKLAMAQVSRVRGSTQVAGVALDEEGPTEEVEVDLSDLS